jgi:hypothetical protein
MKKAKKNLKYWVISDVKIVLWDNILQANERYNISKKEYDFLLNSIFFKKWSIVLECY